MFSHIFSFRSFIYSTRELNINFLRSADRVNSQICSCCFLLNSNEQVMRLLRVKSIFSLQKMYSRSFTNSCADLQHFIFYSFSMFHLYAELSRSICFLLSTFKSLLKRLNWKIGLLKVSANVPSAEAVPDKDREKAKHLFADFRWLNCLALRLSPALLTALC